MYQVNYSRINLDIILFRRHIARGLPLRNKNSNKLTNRFEYTNLEVSYNKDANKVKVSVQVRNTDERAGDEVVQVYVKDLNASEPVPIQSLQGIKRIHLASGETKNVEFTLNPRQLAVVAEEGQYRFEPGEFEISIGGALPGTVPASTQVISQKINIEGNAYLLD